MRLIGMAVVAVVLSMGFTACSDDDDKDGGGLESQLSGTTWKVTSDTDSDFNTGSNFTFNKDKTLTSTPADWWWTDEDYAMGYEWDEDWENGVFWSVKDDVLTIDWNHDDCMEGTFVIDGKKATYTYFWYDYTSHKTDGEYFTMTLEKQ